MEQSILDAVTNFGEVRPALAMGLDKPRIYIGPIASSIAGLDTLMALRAKQLQIGQAAVSTLVSSQLVWAHPIHKLYYR